MWLYYIPIEPLKKSLKTRFYSLTFKIGLWSRLYSTSEPNYHREIIIK